jgi:hypothetical protein
MANESLLYVGKIWMPAKPDEKKTHTKETKILLNAEDCTNFNNH